MDKRQFLNRVNMWTSYWRKNPHRCAKEYLKINLKPFQELLLWMMFMNHIVVIIAARGLGKTWLTAMYCILRCILYPGTKVVIASGTKSQSMKIVTEKIPEIMNMTPVLKYEIADIKPNMNTDEANVKFHNGSWIKVVPSSENARSARANVLILDEYRLIKEHIYKNTLRRFLAVSRQPRYLSDPKYSHMQERNIEIFLSSAYYKFDWCWQKFKSFFKQMTNGENYCAIGLPYQVSVMSGLVMKEQLQDEVNEPDFDETIWSMEMESLFFGESENAFFELSDLIKNRTKNQAIYPKEIYDMVKSKDLSYVPKKNGRIRYISCDIATKSGKLNDASVFSLFELKANKYGYSREVLYMESLVGGHTVSQAVRINQLFKDFDCDYIVIDTQSAGIGIYDILAAGVFDEERNIEYDPISCMNDDELADRCVESSAPKIVFSVRASASLNSEMATSIRDCFKRGKLKLLCEEEDAKNSLTRIKGYEKLSAEGKELLLLPFKQTTAFVNETINLERVDSGNHLIKLKEPSGMRKDRFSSVEYGNYFANYLERKFYKRKESNNMLDYLNIGW